MNFEDFFRNKNLKKIPRVGIHYEQKTTPDLIWCVSHIILELTKSRQDMDFTDKDIRSSSLFDTLMQDYFSKPPQEEANNEYNKVSSYQLGLLLFAGVLAQTQKKPKKYKIADVSVLDYMAINDLNASKFLTAYTEKFLKDNGLIDVFENYRENPNQQYHQKAKEAYWNWAKVNTAVKGDNRRHSYRVFNKIFNIYCYKNHIPGEDASNITTGPCPYSYLLYNRTNFRDENMPSGMTRNQYKNEVLSAIEQNGVVETLLAKAKESIKQKYGNESEIQNITLGYTKNSGVHVHHVLPKQSYPQFSLAKENLIVLTPGQHLSFAHIKGDTRTINPEFQFICMKKKLEHIKLSLEQGEDFFDLKEFINIVNVCYNLNLADDSKIELIESKFEERRLSS